MMKTAITNKNNFRQLQFSVLGTFIFYMAANGFILFNYVPQHDSLNYISNFTGNWELILGRFLLPVYGFFRGELTVPLLTGIISIICLSIMTYYVTDLLEINKPLYILLAAAFLSANITHTELLSSFIYVEDACMTAAMLACISVYILNRTDKTKWRALSIALLVLSMGLYQAYLATAATLILLLSMKEILKSGKFGREEIRKLILNTFILVIACIIYFLIKNLIMMFSGLQEASDYHSLTNILHDLGSIPSRLYVNYGSKISMFFFRKEMSLGRIGNCLLAISVVFIIYRIFRLQKINFKTRLIFIILFLISTLTSLMFNIGAGMIAYRLSFAIFLYYLFIISVLELFNDKFSEKVIQNRAMCILLASVIWSNLVYSNGAYTTQKVIFDRSISLYTRVLDDMYEIPEYVHNTTPVILLGDYTFDDYAYDLSKKEYRDLGTFKNTSVTYPLTVKNMMRYLGEEVNLVRDENTVSKFIEKQETKSMPSFPYKGYIQMVDNYLVIHF